VGSLQHNYTAAVAEPSTMSANSLAKRSPILCRLNKSIMNQPLHVTPNDTSFLNTCSTTTYNSHLPPSVAQNQPRIPNHPDQVPCIHATHEKKQSRHPPRARGGVRHARMRAKKQAALRWTWHLEADVAVLGWRLASVTVFGRALGTVGT
jgi:hypothetical protein